MTRNPLVDIDLEALGAGILVDPYDVAAWRRALERLIADPSLTREMGRRARRAAEDHLNLRRFAGDLAAVLRTVLARSH
jgi:glycosyltransferase involved in cell wall biosynthesis